MDKRMKMDEKTRMEIWEAFKDKLIEEGINSPEEIVLQDKIPDESELVKNGTILKKIGRVGKCVIWVAKAAVWVGSAIVVYAALPGALEQIRTRHPQTFEVVDSIGEAIRSYNGGGGATGFWEGESESEYRGQYVVFNENWANDEAKFAEDVKDLDDSGKISDDSVLAPASGLDEVAIIQSDISVSLSDFS